MLEIKSKMKFNIIFVLFSLIIVLIMRPQEIEMFSKELNFIFTIIAISNVLLFWKTSANIINHWLRFEVLFLIGFLIVNFQIPFSASLGWEPENSNFIWINKYVVNFATYLSLLALLFWILGFLIFGYLSNNNKQKTNTIDKINLLLTLKRLKFTLFILFPLFIILSGKDSLSGAYATTDHLTGRSYVLMLLQSTLVINIIVFFIYYKKQLTTKKGIWNVFSQNKTFIIILLLYVLFFLSTGSRNSIISIFIIAGLMYSLTQIRIKGVTFLLIIITSATLMTVIKMGRTGDISTRTESNILKEGYSKYKDKDDFNPTLELASSNRILYRAIDVVPHKHPYLYGVTMMGDIISAVPLAAGILFPIIALPKQYTSSSSFFTYLGQGSFSTWGEGSQLVADIYVNFGLFGVVFIMFIFGGVILKLTYGFKSFDSLLKIIIYVSITMSAIFINRGTLFNIIQPLILLIIIFKVMTFTRK